MIQPIQFYCDGVRIWRWGFRIHWRWTRGISLGIELMPSIFVRVEIRLLFVTFTILHVTTWAMVPRTTK